MSVDIDAKEASMDGFVDEIITLNIGVPSWADHAKNSALLAIHTIFRPLHYYEPLKRDDNFCSANYHDKVASQNTREVLVGKSKISLYGNSPQKKKKRRMYRTSGYTCTQQK